MSTLVRDDLSGAYRREGLDPTLRRLVRESRDPSSAQAYRAVDHGSGRALALAR